MNTPVKRAVVPCLLALILVILAQARAHSQTQLHQLNGSGVTQAERFGVSCDISGDRAIVGCDQESNTGAAFIFDVFTGAELFKLTPSFIQPLTFFGCSVAIDGDLAAVGAFGDSVIHPTGGAAYLFDANTGQQLSKIVPADNMTMDYFGVSVSVTDSYLVVGCPGDSNNGAWSGSVYAFDVANGQQLWHREPTDGASGDNFGCSVAASGDRVVVGAFYDDEKGYLSGSAYVFDLTTGQELFKLSALDGAAQDYFGWRVALDGDRVLIGAYHDDDHGQSSGSAYVFDVTTGGQLLKLVPGAGAPQYQFGYSVSIGGGIAVVGAPCNSTAGILAGCAYSFDAYTGEELGQLFADDASADDQLGWSIGFDGVYSIIGAPRRADFTGTGYIFDPLPAGIGYCFGDLGLGTPCPCGNDNDGSVPGSGCANGASASGAKLTGGGAPSVSMDSFVLTASGLDPNNSGLYFQADNRIDDGNGILFGDGLRCAGGALVRLQVRVSSSSGDSATSISLSAKGGVSAGDTKRYQCWYRDTSGLQPCGVGVNDFNLSNGYEVTWRP